MRNRRNYYRLLQVQPDAPVEIIRASFRTMMRELRQHPDLGGSTDRAALLIEAYETLADPGRRTAYDRKLTVRYPRNAAASGSSEEKAPIPTACQFCGHRLVRQAGPGDHCPECGIPLLSSKGPAPAGPRRRSLDRIRRNETVYYWSAWPQKPREARMTDLSPSGMGFLCGERLSPGTRLKISSQTLTASAVVTHLREEGRQGRREYEVGVSFLAVDFEDARGCFISVSG